jgi:hypothetical protein
MITGTNRRHRGYQAEAHSAHRSILDQHRELRRLLALGLVQTCALSGRHSEPAVLRALVGQIKTVFVAHLSYEVAALLPLFDDERLGGPRRTQILREEHARQRREMETLYTLSEEGRSDELADRFDGLARTLLVDIAEEEREFALAVAIIDRRAAQTCDGVPCPMAPGKHHGSRTIRVESTATGSCNADSSIALI